MSERQIEIVKDDDPFTVVYNELIFDENLRLQTKMVLIMMTSFRPDWDFSIRGMASIAHVTKDTMSKMLAELEEAGYVKRKEQPRGSAGRFAKAGYWVSRKPIFRADVDIGTKNQDADAPCPDAPYTDKPYTKNSPQLNTKQPITEQLNTPYSPPTGDGAPPEDIQEDAAADKPAPSPKPRRSRARKAVPTYAPERFEQFWAFYPAPSGSRLKAVAEWDALAPDDGLIAEMGRALKRQKKSPQWRDGIGIPHACRWLRDRRWTDKLPDPATDDGGLRWADDPEH